MGRMFPAGSTRRAGAPAWEQGVDADFVELIPPMPARTADRLFRGWAYNAGLNRARLRRDVRRELVRRGEEELCTYLVRHRTAVLSPAPADPSDQRVMPPPRPLPLPGPKRQKRRRPKRYRYEILLTEEEMRAARLGSQWRLGFAGTMLALAVLYVICTLVLTATGGGGVPEASLRAMGIAALVVTYGVSFVSLVSGFIRRRDREPTFFAKQVAVLGGSIPSVTILALAVLFADISTFARVTIVFVYGAVYCGIVREFVELPPTREEMREALRRFLSPRIP